MAGHCRYSAAESLQSTVEMQKAWHLSAILLQIGRPASLEELAARCELFCATPEFVRYLCSIPSSPICLAENGFVLISMVAISAMGWYVSKAMNGWGGFLRRDYGVREANRFWGSDVKTYFRKRKRSVLDDGVSFADEKMITSASRDVVGDGSCLSFTRRISRKLTEVAADYVNITTSNLPTVVLSTGNVEMGHLDVRKYEVPLCLDHDGFPNFLLNYAGHMEADTDFQTNKSMDKDDTGSVCENRLGCHTLEVQKDWIIPNPRHTDRGILCNLDLCLGPPCSYTYPVLNEKILFKDKLLANKSGSTSELRLEDGMHSLVPLLEADSRFSGGHFSDILGSRLEEEKNKICRIKSTEYSGIRECNLVHSERHAVADEAEGNFIGCKSPVKRFNFEKDDTSVKEETQLEQLAETFVKLNGAQNCTLSSEKILMESAVNKEVFKPSKQQNRCNDVPKLVSKAQKLKKSSKEKVHARENPLDFATVPPKLEETALPQFESFIIEEAEGSGGYGTVYRARRKNDGKRIAIKCPHVNAHKHNINNEKKMLERFGGRSFIIKYEGSFSSGSSECFILEHIEHDRPEVLKKEIDFVQLRWYGYCLFRALAFLHKQGVMHRDVKPGNFLFSRKQNKGYLIDFNLSMDLHQKNSIASKSSSSKPASLDQVPAPPSISGSTIKEKKNFRGDFESLRKGATGKCKQTNEHNIILKKRDYVGPSKNYLGMGGHAIRSQVADGSGITSVKDVTSARTPSTENLREPLPSQGRKELISLVQNALLSTDHVIPNSSVLQRKRVAAPPGKAESKFVYPSPMLAHCSGVSIASSRTLKNKGDGKRKREGPCAGTKGFRAPEVLLRSQHQGPLVDVWSAGVTLLYLIVGRSPFTGDVEQNIKDIAKLRGSEDLWEVAKLHDRESAFPGELFHVQLFPAMDLRSWCKAHTRRPELLNLIPPSLFDLVDKCLTVNPRLRITAEEALKHEFFKSCHESLRKQRMLRRGYSLNSEDSQNEAVRGWSTPCELSK